MSLLVLDSCVVAKLVLKEVDSALADQLALDVTTRGDQIAILDLALIECGNIIWKPFRARRVSSTEAKLALETLQESKFSIFRSDALMKKSLDLAMKYDRAFYDTLFVALVDDLQAAGVTADERLVHAIERDFPRVKLLKDWTFLA
jgi:predicted nucleic acid-binding protein